MTRKIYLLIIIFIPFLACQKRQEFVNNRFYINSFEVQLVDYLGKDINGCDSLGIFLPERDNLYSGIKVNLRKKYVSDSTRKSPILSYVREGIDGSIDSIINFKIFTENKIEITDSLNGFVGFRSYDSIYCVNCTEYKELSKNKTCNLENPFFDNPSQFVDSYNNKKIKIPGNKLNKELFFWVEKKKLLSLSQNKGLLILFDTDKIKHEVKISL